MLLLTASLRLTCGGKNRVWLKAVSTNHLMAEPDARHSVYQLTTAHPAHVELLLFRSDIPHEIGPVTYIGVNKGQNRHENRRAM